MLYVMQSLCQFRDLQSYKLHTYKLLSISLILLEQWKNNCTSCVEWCKYEGTEPSQEVKPTHILFHRHSFKMSERWAVLGHLTSVFSVILSTFTLCTVLKLFSFDFSVKHFTHVEWKKWLNVSFTACCHETGCPHTAWGSKAAFLCEGITMLLQAWWLQTQEQQQLHIHQSAPDLLLAAGLTSDRSH